MVYKELTEENFNKEVGNGKWIVDFWAPWCGPCRIMAPEFEKASEDNHNVNFAKVNVDENSHVASNFQIMSIPTLVVIENGEVVNRTSGVLEKQEILNFIEKSFN